MSKIDDMIAELRPDGVEYEWFGGCLYSLICLKGCFVNGTKPVYNG